MKMERILSYSKHIFVACTLLLPFPFHGTKYKYRPHDRFKFHSVLLLCQSVCYTSKEEENFSALTTKLRANHLPFPPISNPNLAMELHSQTAAKKIWDYLRAVLFMLKVKSVISKRKLIMDANLLMNRSKFIGKSITNLLTHKHQHSHHSIRDPSLLNEYEFSCHNSPNPLFFSAKRGQNKRGYFSCLNAPVEEQSEEQEADMRTPLRLEYTSQELRGLTTPASPFDVRVSDFSELQTEESSGNGNVDSEAEDFIKRFYEQLKRQKEIGLLEYPQTEE